ncbi:MAG: RNA ligase family protein [Candidatus Helarchaeota archaeon]
MNLVNNPSKNYLLAPIEGEILSTNGRVKVLDLVIPPYPKLLHLSNLTTPMLAQLKVNGYNVRVAYIPELSNFVALLRGGYICAKTTHVLRKEFSPIFLKFFEDHPQKILVMEVLGKDTLANLHVDYYKQTYDFKSVGYFVFDIMDLKRPDSERFLPFKDVKYLCETYNLQLIPLLGTFERLDALDEKLREVSPVFEGVVMKSFDGKERLKYRFDQKPELFADKLPKKKEKKVSPEQVIVDHFFQGYGEPELGLNSGISQEEMEQYQQRLDSLKATLEKDPSKIGEGTQEILRFLIELIRIHGVFDENRLSAIKKTLKKQVGSKIGKILKKIRETSKNPKT